MKILVIKLGALGDVVIATPIIRRIQAHHRDADLWVLTSPAYAELFAAWQGIHVKTIERHGLKNLVRAIAWIRSMRFDRIYDLQSNDRTSVIMALSGAKVRVGNHPRFPYTHHPGYTYRGEEHIFDRMNRVLESAGVPPARPEPHIPVSDPSRKKVLAWLESKGLLGKDYVVMHAGASRRWETKRWPYYAELAERLHGQGFNIVWVGGDDDAETNRVLASRTGVDATGRFTIPELVELGRHARFAVTNDSGPMHALSASGIPVFAFFGPTDWKRSHAVGQGEHVMASTIDCSPCFKPVCPMEKGHACMRGITPEAVMGRIERYARMHRGS